jgi:predicted enzyme related to lactoylglutathione lyase
MDVHAYIAVMDLQRGIAFYTQGLGLRLRRRLGAIFLLSSDTPRDVAGYWTVHLDFLTDDLEAAVKQAQDAGAVLIRDLEVQTWGRMANMTDPFGATALI